MNHYHRINKKDFLKIKEEDVMFITNPGRMGDEDGSTFIVKRGDDFTIYRVDGWMYPNKDIKQEERITMEDMAKQFPQWYEAWEHGEEENDSGKYKHLYMGFGNGLNIDHSIYEEYKPYLEKAVEKFLEKYKETEKEALQYAAIFNTWEKAFNHMVKDRNHEKRVLSGIQSPHKMIIS
ncbi:MAG: hypothetical protein J6X28_02655 [Bacilli bacterium]|nr:hypothetical protein [Bacilli bacterium]